MSPKLRLNMAKQLGSLDPECLDNSLRAQPSLTMFPFLSLCGCKGVGSGPI